MNNIPEIYRLAIKATHPNAQNLRTPAVCGSQQNVIFADIEIRHRRYYQEKRCYQ